MKPASIGIIAFGLLTAGALTFYYLHTPQEQTGAVIERLPAIPTPPLVAPKENSATPSADIASQESTPKSDQEAGASIATIPVGRDFKSLLENDINVNKIHAKLEQEPRDLNWAREKEAEFRDFFAGKPELIRYGIPEVECRTSMCEVRLVASGPEKSEDLYKLLIKPGSLPWPGELDVVVDGDDRNPEGVTTVLIQTMFKSRPTTSNK